MAPTTEPKEHTHSGLAAIISYYISSMIDRLSKFIPGFGQSRSHEDDSDEKKRWSMVTLGGGKRALNSVRRRVRKSKHIEILIDRLATMRLSSSSDYSQLGQDDSDSKVTTENEKAFAVKVAPDASSVDSTSSNEPNGPGSLLRSTKPSELLDLPQELFDEITSYLGPAHIVVLALVNKELFSRFIHSQVKPNLVGLDPNPSPLPLSDHWKVLGEFIKKADTTKAKARGTLLSLLDNDLPNLVYCYKCKKMHDPFVTFIDRDYVPKKSHRCVDNDADRHMPPRATRKLLRVITKRRKRGASYRDLISQVNNTTTCYKNGIMVQVSLRMRYRGDLLLLRRQQVVSSIDKTALSLWLFRQQLKSLVPTGMSGNQSTANPKVHKICNHATWAEKYTDLLEEMTDSLCKKTPTGNEAHIHSTPCFRSQDGRQEPFDAANEKGHRVAKRFREFKTGVKPVPAELPNPDDRARLGDVLGCAHCTTDFSIDMVTLPSPFHWGFVLTTWLDLGNIDFCTKWDSHREVRPGRHYNRTPPHGEICRNFENSTGEKWQYRPKINALDLARMNNYGWGEMAAMKGGAERHMAWSSGHAADPVTGRILNPDPLEDDDLVGDALMK